MADKKTAIKKEAEDPISSTLEKKKQIKKHELRKKGVGLKLQSGGPTVLNPKWKGQSGGRATHGYGRAYMKGGKV